MQETEETQVRFLGREDPLKEGMGTHSSNLAWSIPMDRGAWQGTAHGVAKSRTRLSNKAQHSTRVKDIWVFFFFLVVFLQLFFKYEIISKQKVKKNLINIHFVLLLLNIICFRNI